jgi:hypothetical protein
MLFNRKQMDNINNTIGLIVFGIHTFTILFTLYCITICNPHDICFVFSILFWLMYMVCFFYYKKNIFFEYENTFLHIQDNTWHNITTPFYQYLDKQNIEISNNIIFNSAICYSIIMIIVILIKLIL